MQCPLLPTQVDCIKLKLALERQELVDRIEVQELMLSKHREYIECKTPGMHVNWSARAVVSMLKKRESSGQWFHFCQKVEKSPLHELKC